MCTLCCGRFVSLLRRGYECQASHVSPDTSFQNSSEHIGYLVDADERSGRIPDTQHELVAFEIKFGGDASNRSFRVGEGRCAQRSGFDQRDPPIRRISGSGGDRKGTIYKIEVGKAELPVAHQRAVGRVQFAIKLRPVVQRDVPSKAAVAAQESARRDGERLGYSRVVAVDS